MFYSDEINEHQEHHYRHTPLMWRPFFLCNGLGEALLLGMDLHHFTPKPHLSWANNDIRVMKCCLSGAEVMLPNPSWHSVVIAYRSQVMAYFSIIFNLLDLGFS